MPTMKKQKVCNSEKSACLFLTKIECQKLKPKAKKTYVKANSQKLGVDQENRNPTKKVKSKNS